MLDVNPILRTDSYKCSHAYQYPIGTTNVSSYIEARKRNENDDTIITFFGLQPWLIETFCYSGRIRKSMINDAHVFAEKHGVPFNREGFERIVDVHDGYWPVHIEAIPEGERVPVGTALVQMHNNDSQLPWVTSYLETSLLRAIWYPTTVATRSRQCRDIIYHFLNMTSDDPENQINFKLHDFGARGVSSGESAQLGGMAHLLNFMGSDTIEGIVAAQRYYGADMPGFSIPASEHSTITAWGKDREAAAYRNMITQFDGENKLFACVSDSYDIQNAVENIWGGTLRDRVQNLKGTLVIRPDSGDPVQMTEMVLKSLIDKFGCTTNTKGYQVLPKFVRVIQGDGVNIDTIYMILKNLSDLKISAENIAFGMGGELLQNLNRDTYRFAMKMNAISYDEGETWQAVRKEVISDPSKASKGGRQKVIFTDKGEYLTLPIQAPVPDGSVNLMRTVYDRKIVMDSWENVRERALI